MFRKLDLLLSSGKMKVAPSPVIEINPEKIRMVGDPMGELHVLGAYTAFQKTINGIMNISCGLGFFHINQYSSDE
jgi:hypothetical protein